MATKAEIAKARAARRKKDASRKRALAGNYGASPVSPGNPVPGVPGAFFPRNTSHASPEIVGVFARPGDPDQKVDYLGNLYELPSDEQLKAKINAFVNSATRDQLNALVKYAADETAKIKVHHQIPNAISGAMEYYDEAGNLIVPVAAGAVVAEPKKETKKEKKSRLAAEKKAAKA